MQTAQMIQVVTGTGGGKGESKCVSRRGRTYHRRANHTHRHGEGKRVIRGEDEANPRNEGKEVADGWISAAGDMAINARKDTHDLPHPHFLLPQGPTCPGTKTKGS